MADRVISTRKPDVSVGLGLIIFAVSLVSFISGVVVGLFLRLP